MGGDQPIWKAKDDVIYGRLSTKSDVLAKDLVWNHWTIQFWEIQTISLFLDLVSSEKQKKASSISLSFPFLKTYTNPRESKNAVSYGNKKKPNTLEQRSN